MKVLFNYKVKIFRELVANDLQIEYLFILDYTVLVIMNHSIMIPCL